MDHKLTKHSVTTVVSTGRGQDKAIIVGKPQISSQTGRVAGGNQVDVVFVFDTTGSMDDEIDGLLSTCTQFVDEAQKMGLDANFALISFGDISIAGGGDKIETVTPLTSEVERIKFGLRHIPRNNGFGNEGETCLEAIQEAFKIQHRTKAVKVLILITDEPAVVRNITPEQITKELTRREYLTFVIAIDMQYYKDMAIKNGGVWKQISSSTDLSEILKIFGEVAKKVSEITKKVHLLGGSVSRYLALNPPKN